MPETLTSSLGKYMLHLCIFKISVIKWGLKPWFTAVFPCLRIVHQLNMLLMTIHVTKTSSIKKQEMVWSKRIEISMDKIHLKNLPLFQDAVSVRRGLDKAVRPADRASRGGYPPMGRNDQPSPVVGEGKLCYSRWAHYIWVHCARTLERNPRSGRKASWGM